jgi:hypothetical protein
MIGKERGKTTGVVLKSSVSLVTPKHQAVRRGTIKRNLNQVTRTGRCLWQ